ncbi:hypothetical protein ANN_11946 [Periplaneta americana]|uniref:DUF4817 domain-containing protein n=1 Tax=Periplaneta americana TaxID=6978 RepID=A0ABQ8T8Q8_PERAM|nr:hypothetical protein ANN_11946 [Periplaneta americana]
MDCKIPRIRHPNNRQYQNNGTFGYAKKENSHSREREYSKIGTSLTTAQFADDVAVLCKNSSEMVANKLQQFLHLVDVWCEKWKVKMNPSKSNVIQFTYKRKTENQSITLQDLYFAPYNIPRVQFKVCHGSLYAVMWLVDGPREFNLPTLPQRHITYVPEKLPGKYGVHSEEYVLIRTVMPLFPTFCVNVKMQYTLNQRLFLVKQYWITNSITATQRAYQREFGVRNPPKRNTILGLVNKLETTGSLLSEKDKHRSSRLPTVVVDKPVATEISGFDNAGLLSMGLLKRQGLRHTSPDIGRSEVQHHTGDSSY